LVLRGAVKIVPGKAYHILIERSIGLAFTFFAFMRSVSL
jgi:hypothetical protein